MGCWLDDVDLLAFHEGKNLVLYESLGCRRREGDVCSFAVWAPSAQSVSVVGDFNGWDPKRNPMELHGGMGVWEAEIPRLRRGELYKYYVVQKDGAAVYKADPFAFTCELRPKTASLVWELDGFEWDDAKWLKERRGIQGEPVSVYEIHAGSWRNCDYRTLADQLVPYVLGLGFTHIQFMPLCEHVLDASWGYQSTGFFSATSRFGTPQELMYLVNKCHRHGIGVIMDWVSAYIPYEEHGLRRFDGTALFEPPDYSEPNSFGTTPFDFEKPEVRSFLLSNAMFWLREYHLDGLHIPNVSAMLYPAHGREDYGITQSQGARIFLEDLEQAVNAEFSGVIISGAEFNAISALTKPKSAGGLGLTCKWDGAFAKDMLEYMRIDPLYRKWNHNKLTAPMMTAFQERRVLALSHAETVHGKGSLLDQMPGEYDQKFAQLRLLLSFMYAQPGKKLLFMGAEFAQFAEWRYDKQLDWMLLDYKMHTAMMRFVEDLNAFYRNTPAFFALDDSWQGFEWLTVNDEIHSIIAFTRIIERADGDDEHVACVFNFNPNPYEAYRLGVSNEGVYEAVMNSAFLKYGGTIEEKAVRLSSQPIGWNEKRYSVVLRIPSYGAIYLRRIPLLEDEALAE